jgi:hypothetical protein
VDAGEPGRRRRFRPRRRVGSRADPIFRQYRDHRLEWMMKSGGVEIVLAGLRNGTIRFAEGHG